MGQCSNRGTAEQYDIMPPAVSLEKAKSLSSNAAVTSARYHYSQGGRKLTDDYVVDGKVLGQGLCGDVVLVKSKIDNRRYALKTIRKQQVSAAKLEQLTAEVEIYLTLDHPNIARLHNVYETENEICLLTECCDGGELYFRLQKRGVYTDADAAQATQHMLRAVGYLHAHNVVHRDLKLENFLYESDEGRDGESQLKLIDFGFAKIWDPSTLMMASCGSIAYVSPDVLSGRGYTNKCDLWSLGVIVWMLLAGYPPFHGDEKLMMSKIKAGQADWSHKSRWKPVSPDAIDLLQRLLNKDPKQRPDAQEALAHPWLTSRSIGSAPVVLGRDALRSIERYTNSSKVRRAVLQLLAQELSPDETRDLREIFLSIDQSNKGTICFHDLKDAVRGTAAPKTPNRRKGTTEAIMSIPTPCAALNGNSPLCSPEASQSTFGSGMGESSPGSPTTPARTLRRMNSGKLDELFRLIDSHGDERIHYSDFLAATLEARSRLREEAVRATFSRFDVDRSGAITVGDLRLVLGDTFEGVNVEELVLQADRKGKGEIHFEDFIRVVEDRDLTPTPTSPVRGRTRTSPVSPQKRLTFFPEAKEASFGGC